MSSPIAASNIAAQAFRAMELSPISAFDDDSQQAADASEQYTIALRSCLETCDWSFASKLTTLALATPPATGFVADADLPGLYKLPGDCVLIREVRPRETRWRLDEDFLRADTDQPLTIRYTRLIETEAQLPASFQTAVAYRLAVLMAPRWVGSRSKRQDLRDEAQDVLKEAERNDARSASSERYDDGEPYRSFDWATEATR